MTSPTPEEALAFAQIAEDLEFAAADVMMEELRVQLAAAREALQSYMDMMAEWQTETTNYLCDRHTADSYINCVIYMQDGPEQRERDQRAKAALSGAPR